MNICTASEEETVDLGVRLGETLRPGGVVALYGGLGAGKTAFTRGIARALGISDWITSPTYTIVNEYAGCPPLFHFDMYRIDTGTDAEEQLFNIGWDEYLERGGVTVVEWSENISDFIPDDAVRVIINIQPDNSRRIDILGGAI